MRRCFRADLHIHSCLSPCGDLMMSPRMIVQSAVARQLDMIALCDHNSAENVLATMKAARNTGLTVLAGMEVTSAEEVHVCGIFDDHDSVLTLQQQVYDALAPGENDPEYFGDQVIVNEIDEIEGYSKKLLIGATTMSINRIVSEIHQIGGIVIASHVDRETYGIIGQLGFIPPDLEIDALEISRRTTYDEAVKMVPQISNYAVVSSSDAHAPSDIGAVFSTFMIEAPTVGELRKAFRKENGRSVLPGR